MYHVYQLSGPPTVFPRTEKCPSQQKRHSTPKRAMPHIFHEPEPENALGASHSTIAVLECWCRNLCRRLELPLLFLLLFLWVCPRSGGRLSALRLTRVRPSDVVRKWCFSDGLRVAASVDKNLDLLIWSFAVIDKVRIAAAMKIHCLRSPVISCGPS